LDILADITISGINLPAQCGGCINFHLGILLANNNASRIDLGSFQVCQTEAPSKTFTGVEACLPAAWAGQQVQYQIFNGSGICGNSGNCVVPAAPNGAFAIVPNKLVVSPGDPINLTVSALNANGTVQTGYLGTTHYASTDALAVVPSNYAFVAADAGVHVFPSTNNTNTTRLYTLGYQAIGVNDVAVPSRRGISPLILVVSPTSTWTPTPTLTPTLTYTRTWTPTWTITPSFTPTVTKTSTPLPATCCYQFATSWGSTGTGNSQFNFTYSGVAVGSDGNIYAVDTGNKRVQIFNPSGQYLSQWTGTGNEPLNNPAGITADASGHIYIADQVNDLVQVYTNAGTPVTYWGGPSLGPGGFIGLEDVALDPTNGNIWTIQTGQMSNAPAWVQEFTPSGTLVQRWGGVYGTGNGQFNFPMGIVVGPDGSVYVADTSNSRIQKFSQSGNYLLQWGNTGGPGSVGQPYYMAADSSGNIYVADYGFGGFQKYDANGNFICAHNTVADGVGSPFGLALDAGRNLYVAGYGLNEMGKYIPSCSTATNTPAFTATPSPTPTVTPTPTCNPCQLAMDQAANLVVGQPDFTTSTNSPVNASSLSGPEGVFQAGSNLFVLDTSNHRVLIYNPIPTGNQPTASKVIGQASFTGNSANQGGAVSSTTLNNPQGIWSNGSTLVVSDLFNNRVLIYRNINALPTVNGQADVVLGQPDMVHNQANQGGNTARNGMLGPTGVFFDGQWLYVLDTFNNRLLIYKSLPTANGALPDLVIGQPDFVSNGANQGLSGPTSQTLWDPRGVWVSNGNLYVADTGNNRVLVYNNGGQGINTLQAGSASVTADMVLGQAGFTTNGSGTSASLMLNPTGVSVGNCQLFITDLANDRVLVYNSIPVTNNTPADLALGQVDLNTSGAPGAAQANNLYLPWGLYAAGDGLYVTDSNQNRVLKYTCQAGTGTSQAMARSSSALRTEGTITPTPTPSITITPSATPTPTVGSVAVVAAPNISRNGETIRFQVALPKTAQIQLALYTITGEQVYQTTVQGNPGLNNLLWPLENQRNQLVASGLYIYTLEVNDGFRMTKITGKVVVVH
jgi:predicted outer membrane repeat protein